MTYQIEYARNGFFPRNQICRWSPARQRKGAVARILLFYLLSGLVVAALGYSALKLRPDAQRNASSHSVVRVYCASGVAKPVQQIIDTYNRQYGAQIELARTGGSGELAGQIKTEFEAGITSGADLYVTADDQLLEKAHAEGIVAERFPLASQKPVIAIPARSELKIKSLPDLVAQSKIRFGIASERAAIGKLVREIAQRDGVLELLESKKITDSENVMTLAQALVTGSLDAAVVWDSTVAQINQLQPHGVHPPLKISALADPRDEHQARIAIGVLTTTRLPTDCLKFARYLTAPETAGKTFEKFGFSFIEGDPWEEIPEIHLYFGSMFTPVLEPAVREFARREGANIYPRWEGCGKLVASIRGIDDLDIFPDAYLACDVMFMESVQPFFQTPTTISGNRIVMAVRKNIGVQIKGPQDLLGHDLRIGICDPDQSALGELTKQMLSREPFMGLYQRINKKAAVTVDVGPTLISQLLSGGLDVAFVYRSNIMADRRSLDDVRIVEIDKRSKISLAVQPGAISKSTRNPALMQRFFDWINRPLIKQRFQELGFQMVDP